METLILAIVLLYLVALVYGSFAVAAYRLMLLEGHDRRWRAFVPVWNILLLFDIADESRWLAALLIVPVLGYFVLSFVGGRLAVLTGRPKWIGWIAGFYTLHVIGLPVLALTATRAKMDSTKTTWRYRYGSSNQNNAP